MSHNCNLFFRCHPSVAILYYYYEPLIIIFLSINHLLLYLTINLFLLIYFQFLFLSYNHFLFLIANLSVFNSQFQFIILVVLYNLIVHLEL